MGMSKYRRPKTIDPIEPEPVYVYVRSVKDIVGEAKKKKMWVYDPGKKDWFSPEEFESLWGRVCNGIQPFLDKVQIRDPMEGIRAGNQRLQDMQIKLEDFTKKVVEYYRGE
jgi:hypothetical protein